MLSIEAYKNFLLKINRNDTNSDIDINKGEFVLLYNEQKDRWLINELEKKESTIAIQDLEEVQAKHKQLQKVKDEPTYSVFKLPDNFFSYGSSYSVVSSDDCQGVIIRNHPFKPKNENMLLEDSNWQPSLEYEETIVDLSDNNLFVYKSNFNVDEVFLNYYREVGKIDIAGYRKVDGTLSTDIHPDISDVYVNQILDRCALEIIRRYENPDGYQLRDDSIRKEE
jgi:hypothetical protein